MKKVLIFILGFSISLSLWANLPANLPLLGQGDYSWYFLHIYQAKLFTENSYDLYSRPLILELKYSRALKGVDIVEQSLKELNHAGFSIEEQNFWKPKLLEIFPDVNDGDSIQASFSPKNGITFYLNRTKNLGSLNDLNFDKLFLDIWLGEKTSAKDLRNKLLGKTK